MCHHTQLIFIFFIFVETRSHYNTQFGLKLFDSSDPPALASESAGIIGVSHLDYPVLFLLPDLRFSKYIIGGSGYLKSPIPVLMSSVKVVRLKMESLMLFFF